MQAGSRRRPVCFLSHVLRIKYPHSSGLAALDEKMTQDALYLTSAIEQRHFLCRLYADDSMYAHALRNTTLSNTSKSGSAMAWRGDTKPDRSDSTAPVKLRANHTHSTDDHYIQEERLLKSCLTLGLSFPSLNRCEAVRKTGFSPVSYSHILMLCQKAAEHLGLIRSLGCADTRILRRYSVQLVHG